MTSVIQATPDQVEELTRQIGHEILARLPATRPAIWQAEWWDDQIMHWAMEDEAVKVQMFRFIDVLPMLHRPEQVVEHLKDYLGRYADQLPAAIRIGLELTPSRSAAGRAVAAAARRNALRMARRFIAGSTPAEAVQAVRRLRRAGMGFTLDLLGEATITEPEADRYMQSYLDLIDGLSAQVNAWPEVPAIDHAAWGPLPRVNVSLKLSSLDSRFDPIDPEGTLRRVGGRLRSILRRARRRGAYVHVDMEQYATKDLTLEIFERVLMEDEFRDWTETGIVIQAYLTDAAADLRRLHAWVLRRGAPITVRLVKGAYWDYETVHARLEGWPVPVYEQKSQTDASFERQVEFLMEHADELRPAIGSHNVRSLAHAVAVAEVRGLPPSAYELQMLYGMADPIKAVLAGRGQRVRVYTPYGELIPGMAYLVRRLLENTSNESFLRASFTEHLPEEVLLMNPLDHPPAVRAGPAAAAAPAADPGPRFDVQDFQNEPLTDFSRAANRQEFRRAVDAVRDRFDRYYPLVIGGVEVRTPAELVSLNPSHTSQVVGRTARATPADAERAIAVARENFPRWRDTPAAERAEYLRRAADAMRRRRFELAAWEVHECGKEWREADGDVAEAIDYCTFYAAAMIDLARGRRIDLAGEENDYEYLPRGVTVVIAPWNFPLAILAGMTTAALVAGNPVIMKPAEQSPVIAAHLMDLFAAVGLPPGVLSYLPGDGAEIGPTLVRHPDVALIAFTGSRAVGLEINRLAAEPRPGQRAVKRVIAEMGGKNAMIIDADADLDEAVVGVVQSGFGYQGQKCSACSRAIVLDAIADRFLRRLVEATEALPIGPAEDPGTMIGPVIDREALERIGRYIEVGRAEATLVLGRGVGSLAGEGYYVGPHIFADVPPRARIAQEEIFGPVLAVIRARDLDEAIAIANGTEYALTGGVYSRSPLHVDRVRREFLVGNLYINRPITGALVQRQPFGGFALSGIGSKAGGPDYLLQYLVPRTITENTLRRGFAPPENLGMDLQATEGGI